MQWHANDESRKKNMENSSGKILLQEDSIRDSLT